MKQFPILIALLLTSLGASAVTTNVPISSLPVRAMVANHDAFAIYYWTGTNYIVYQMSGASLLSVMTNVAISQASIATNNIKLRGVTASGASVATTNSGVVNIFTPNGGSTNSINSTNGFGYGTTIFQTVIASNYYGPNINLTNGIGQTISNQINQAVSSMSTNIVITNAAVLVAQDAAQSVVNQKLYQDVSLTIRGYGERAFDAMKVTFNDGTIGHRPGLGYGNVYLRDFLMTREGLPERVTLTESWNILNTWSNTFYQAGWFVDSVDAAKQPNATVLIAWNAFTNNGSTIINPALDCAFDFTHAMFMDYRQRGNPLSFTNHWIVASNGMNFIGWSNSTLTAIPSVRITNDLVYLDKVALLNSPTFKWFGEFGFNDGIPKSGYSLWLSLLRFRALNESSEMAAAAGQVTTASNLAYQARSCSTNLITYLWTSTNWFLSCTITNDVPDAIGSAFAVWIGAVDKPHALLIASNCVATSPGGVAFATKPSLTNGAPYFPGAGNPWKYSPISAPGTSQNQTAWPGFAGMWNYCCALWDGGVAAQNWYTLAATYATWNNAPIEYLAKPGSGNGTSFYMQGAQALSFFDHVATDFQFKNFATNATSGGSGNDPTRVLIQSGVANFLTATNTTFVSNNIILYHGVLATPYQSASNAITASASNDKLLAIGQHGFTARQLATNLTIEAYGSLWSHDQGSVSTPQPLLVPYNSRIYGLNITNAGDPLKQSVAIGFLRQDDYPLARNNSFEVHDFTGYGDYGVAQFYATNSFKGDWFNCRFIGKHFSFVSGGGANFNFFGCNFEAIGPSAFATNAATFDGYAFTGDGSHDAGNHTSTNFLYGCSLVAKSNLVNYALEVEDLSRHVLNGCTLDVYSPGMYDNVAVHFIEHDEYAELNGCTIRIGGATNSTLVADMSITSGAGQGHRLVLNSTFYWPITNGVIVANDGCRVDVCGGNFTPDNFSDPDNVVWHPTYQRSTNVVDYVFRSNTNVVVRVNGSDYPFQVLSNGSAMRLIDVSGNDQWTQANINNNGDAAFQTLNVGGFNFFAAANGSFYFKGIASGDGSGLTNLTGSGSATNAFSVLLTNNVAGYSNRTVLNLIAGSNFQITSVSNHGDVVDVTLGLPSTVNFTAVNVGTLGVTNPIPPEALAATNGVTDGMALTKDHATNKWASISGGGGVSGIGSTLSNTTLFGTTTFVSSNNPVIELFVTPGGLGNLLEVTNGSGDLRTFINANGNLGAHGANLDGVFIGDGKGLTNFQFVSQQVLSGYAGVTSGVPIVVTNWVGITNGDFAIGALTNGTVTNLVAGYYTLSATVNASEDSSFWAIWWETNLVQAGVSVTNGASVAAGTAVKTTESLGAQTFWLPSNTRISLKFWGDFGTTPSIFSATRQIDKR